MVPKNITFSNDLVKCPIYHQDIVSEANLKESCYLCGRNIPKGEQWRTLNESGIEKKFCCLTCLKTYYEIPD